MWDWALNWQAESQTFAQRSGYLVANDIYVYKIVLNMVPWITSLIVTAHTQFESSRRNGDVMEWELNAWKMGTGCNHSW